MRKRKGLRRNYPIALFCLFAAIQVARLVSPSPENATKGEIIFNRAIDYNEGDYYRRVMLYDLETRQEMPLTAMTNVLAISQSHDGSRILAEKQNYFEAFSLIILDANGNERHQLIHATQMAVSKAQWTPDDQRIIFWGFPRQVSQDKRYWAVFDIPADGGQLRRLSPEFFDGLSSSLALAISPDGSRIAYSRHDGLYIMPANGGKASIVRVPFQIVGGLAWSPNGGYIALTGYRRDEASNIYLINTNTHEVKWLVVGTQTLQWSPDGTTLMFKSWDGLGFGFVNMVTGDVRIQEVGKGVLSSIPSVIDAMWSPNGKQIAFSATSRTSYEHNLYVVDSGFTYIQQLTNDMGRDEVVQWR